MVIWRENTSSKKRSLSEATIPLRYIATDKGCETFDGILIESLGKFPRSTVHVKAHIFRSKVYHIEPSLIEIHFEDRSKKIQISITSTMKVTLPSRTAIAFEDDFVKITLYKN